MAPDDAQQQSRRRARAEATRLMKEVAQERETITYMGLASRIVAVRYAPNGDPFSELLTQISRLTFSESGVLLSAVVVRKDDQLPGRGFFVLLDSLGRGGDKAIAWEREVNAVWDHWST